MITLQSLALLLPKFSGSGKVQVLAAETENMDGVATTTLPLQPSLECFIRHVLFPFPGLHTANPEHKFIP